MADDLMAALRASLEAARANRREHRNAGGSCAACREPWPCYWAPEPEPVRDGLADGQPRPAEWKDGHA